MKLGTWDRYANGVHSPQYFCILRRLYIFFYVSFNWSSSGHTPFLVFYSSVDFERHYINIPYNYAQYLPVIPLIPCSHFFCSLSRLSLILPIILYLSFIFEQKPDIFGQLKFFPIIRVISLILPKDQNLTRRRTWSSTLDKQNESCQIYDWCEFVVLDEEMREKLHLIIKA